MKNGENYITHRWFKFLFYISHIFTDKFDENIIELIIFELFMTCYSVPFIISMEKLFKVTFSITLLPLYVRNWWTYLSMIVESMLLGDLVSSLRSAGHVNGELIRIDRHWSRPRSRFGSRTSQQRAHNQ